MPGLRRGLVHIYTGEGKGKTTAALGLGLRAAGCDYKVCIYQFFKDKKFPCGEFAAIKKLGKNFKFKRFDIPHPMFTQPLPWRAFSEAGGTEIKNVTVIDLKLRIKKALNEVRRTITSNKFDVIVLDEILIGVSQGFIEEKEILKIIKLKPKRTELIFTGRGATKRLIASADYVTYMRDIKHPLNNGIKARKGVEF